MKKSQQAPVYKIDEFEDLTLFANESFDTQDVDLFEFSSEESSPLMQLKSIILSLDWEINDEILQELADELEHLESSWQNDKVAEVYLQGLSKIGAYIRSKGAYAHPNSIKLLLTFFYNFEKITSSPNITSEDITQILKIDVRKFRILQYQINQIENESVSGFEEKVSEAAPTETPASHLAQTGHAKQLKAAILSLDWEVTDESLKQFNDSLSPFDGMFADNKPALVLIQGLQTLGDYIAEKRAEAHPEAFALLHSFFEALEQIAATGEQSLDQSNIQDLLTDQINRINNLKMLVAAQTTSPLDTQVIDNFVDEISTPKDSANVIDLPPKITTATPIPQPEFLHENLTLETKPGDNRTDDLLTDTLETEIDTLFSVDLKPAMETANVQYPDEILPADAIHPVEDELADDFIEAHLSTKRGLMPALSDTDEISGYDEAAQPLDFSTQTDLAEQLDFLFPEGDTDTGNLPKMPPAMDSGILEVTRDDEKQPVAALADVNPEDVDELVFAVTDTETGGPDDEAKLRQKESETAQSFLEIQSKLDDFFDEDSGVESALADVNPEDVDKLVFAVTDTDTEEPVEDAELRQKESETAQSSLDIQSKLDNFFADTLEEPAGSGMVTSSSIEDNERSLFFDEDSGVESALADSKEDHGFSEVEAIANLDYTPLGEIEENLDFFFGADDEPVGVKPPEPAAKPKSTPIASDEAPDKELEETLDFFFDANEDDEKVAQQVGDKPTQQLETTTDNLNIIASTFAQEELPAEQRRIQLAALGALLPGVVLSMSREKAAESVQLIATLKKSDLPAGQQALAQLLNSVISLHVRLPKKEEAVTEKLVSYLYEHLLDDQCQPEILPEAINRFTEWLLDAFAIMPPVPIKTGQETEPHFEYTAKELYVELSELRGHINDEFAKLRHELHHKH